MSMWWRIGITLAVVVLLELGFGMLAADGLLGRYGWSIAMIVGAAVAGGVGSALLTPVIRIPWVEGRVRRTSGGHSTPRGRGHARG